MTVEELSQALADKIVNTNQVEKGMEGVPLKKGRFHFMFKERKE